MRELSRSKIRRFSASINPAALDVTRTSTPKTKLPNEELTFGASFTDHMLEIDWDVDSGWKAPKIIPYGPLQIDPAATSLHYALQVSTIA